jgi:hypothetical protein
MMKKHLNRMNRINRIFIAGLAFSTIFTASAFADTASEVSASLGMSFNELKTTTNNINLSPGTVIPTVGSIVEKFKYNTFDFNVKSETLIDEAVYIRGKLGLGSLMGKSTEDVNLSNLAVDPLIMSSPLHPHKKSHRHGSTFNAELALGYCFPISESFSLIPLVGASYQSLQFKKYLDLWSEARYILSPGFRPTQKKKLTWVSPFIGIQAPFSFGNGLEMKAELQYQFSRFKQSVSGPQPIYRIYSTGKKWGGAFLASLKGNYAINESVKVLFEYGFQYSKASPKFNTTLTRDPISLLPVETGTTSGKVTQMSHSIQGGAVFCF